MKLSVSCLFALAQGAPEKRDGLEPISNVADLAQARLTGRFKPSNALNYGCAGRGYFDPFDRTIGKQVDETDKAFYSWKKCVQCALSVDGATPSSDPDIPAYQYDQRTDSCSGMLIFKFKFYDFTVKLAFKKSH